MKRLFTMLALCVVALLGSCSLFSIDEKDFGDQLYFSDIYGKWSGFNQNGYTWIEFTEAGYYYAGSRSGVLSFGRYNKSDSKQFTLDGLGVMDVISRTVGVADDDSSRYYMKFDFAFDSDSANPYYVESSRMAEMEVEEVDEDDLELLCTTWEQVEISCDSGCGCTCEGCECSLNSVCNEDDCNCMCHEDRLEIKYIYFSASGSAVSDVESGYITVIYSDESVKLYTAWKLGDETIIDGRAISYNYESNWVSDAMYIKSLSRDDLILIYKDTDAVSGAISTYTITFADKKSGVLF